MTSYKQTRRVLAVCAPALTAAVMIQSRKNSDPVANDFGCMRDDDGRKGSQHFESHDSEVPDLYPKTSVWWLHVPKCGTSFIETIKRCNSEKDGSIYDHQPMPVDVNLKHVVSMFRQPAQRLASQYAFIPEAPLCVPGWGGNRTIGAEILDRLKKGHTPANDNWLGESFQGCQTNMVLGRTCMAGTPIDIEGDVQKAIRKVKQFMFTGLLERWGLSMCLFNYLATGKVFVEPWQLSHTRPTAAKKSKDEYDTRNYPRDEADERLYAYVAEKFHSETRKYGITAQACSFDSEGNPVELMDSAYR